MNNVQSVPLDCPARLTNLSLRHTGQRPAWFDLEPLTLQGRTRECRRLKWLILTALQAHQKSLFVVTAPLGMGKTSLLAELHESIDNASQDILVLAPGTAVHDKPFSAIRNILEQRFYMTGSATFSQLQAQVEGAIRSIISDPALAIKCIESLLPLWKDPVKDDKSEHEHRALESIDLDIVVSFTDLEAVPSSNSPPPLATKIAPYPVDPNFVDSVEDDEIVAEKTLDIDLNLSDIEGEIAPFIGPLSCLLSNDLKRNKLLVVLDDAPLYDAHSLALLARIYADIKSSQLVYLLTQESAEDLPQEFAAFEPHFFELYSMSDADLEQLTHHVLERLSLSREKHIIPTELCRLIAQSAFGSPASAIAITLKYFLPDRMIHWNKGIEALRREPIPASLKRTLDARLEQCSAEELYTLSYACLLNAPFTAHTIEAIFSALPDYQPTTKTNQILKQLEYGGYIVSATPGSDGRAASFVFKHNYERILLSARGSEEMRSQVYAIAAQWYSLNNPDGSLDETIGDLWRDHNAPLEACYYYERAAYRCLSHSQLSKAWPLLNKFFSCLPAQGTSRNIWVSIDAAGVAFKLGQIDDAFGLNRRAYLLANKMSAYAMAGAACSQMADMLFELGSHKNAKRYLARARSLLNLESKPSMVLKLKLIEARSAYLRAHYVKAGKKLKEAVAYSKTFEAPVGDCLMLEKLQADIDAQCGHPTQALQNLLSLIERSKDAPLLSIQAEAYRSLGNLHYQSQNQAAALEAWNTALGMAQEMNDMVLHASLLCDIAAGAISLKAMRTARSATEQSLSMAQQIHHKTLIGRCLCNNALLHFAQGQYDKSLRALRKAHRFSLKLRSISMIAQSLRIMAISCAQETHPLYNPQKAEILYTELFVIYERHGLKLQTASLLSHYSRFLVQTKQNIAAINALRRAREVYAHFGLKKACDTMQNNIERLLITTSQT